MTPRALHAPVPGLDATRPIAWARGLNFSGPALERSPLLELLRNGAIAVLRMYAGIFFSISPRVGACVLVATLIEPLSGLLGLLAVLCAALTARLLGLLSRASPPSVYAYSALFVGLGASQTFANLYLALALATFGAASAAVITAALRDALGRFGLPALSIPFVLVYACAISTGVALHAAWAMPARSSLTFALSWPAPIRLFFQALGALLFNPNPWVGIVVFAALCLRGSLAPQLAILAFCVVMFADLFLNLSGAGLLLTSLANATFAALALGSGLYPATLESYPRATWGAVLSVFIALGLAEALGRIGVSALSLPFNLSLFAASLIEQQRVIVRKVSA